MPNTPEKPRRVVVDPHGPLLVEGPVTVVGDDGVAVTSDRFMVAICTCRRSRNYPWCDTTHRRRVRPARAGGDRSADRGRGGAGGGTA